MFTIVERMRLFIYLLAKFVNFVLSTNNNCSIPKQIINNFDYFVLNFFQSFPTLLYFYGLSLHAFTSNNIIDTLQYLYLGFVDYAKAFDSIPHHSIREPLYFNVTSRNLQQQRDSRRIVCREMFMNMLASMAKVGDFLVK